MLKVPFYRPTIGEEEIAEVVATLKSGWLTTGPKTHRFEREFAAYVGQKHAVAVNSCTAALHLALEAIGLKAGQGVIVPTMTFAATAEVVRYFNARPILVDCRPEDFNLDVADAERKIQSGLGTGQSVAAIMPMHYGGQIGDVGGVSRLARQYGLKVIEDAAHCCPAYYKKAESRKQKVETGGQQAISLLSASDGERAGGRCDVQPSTSNPQPSASVSSQKSEVSGEVSPRSAGQSPLRLGRGEGQGEVSPSSANPPTSDVRPLASGNAWLPVGAAADISCFSFYANKTITTGEGGMACTAHVEYADRMRLMSLHGISRDAWKRYTAEGSWYYEIVAAGYKYNLTDIAAAIGIHQLRKSDAFHQRRSELVGRYREGLGEVEEIVLPAVQPNRVHSWHLFVIRLKLERLTIDRAQFIDELKQRGIGTSVHWLPLHEHPYYRDTYGYAPQDFPVASSLYPEIVTLPVYPDMTDDDVRYVCDSIKSVLAHR
jgi:dTDP-4-amino-4,6-dideoxygalactose transaminase